MINGQMRIGVYGGTFAPPHNGHVAAARAFLDEMQLDILYIIPTATPPHKEAAAGDTPGDRFRMCELAFSGLPRTLVSDMEIARGGRSYTVETLRALAGEDRRLFLLLGTDMMLSLSEWREPEEIFKLSYPVYMRRENDPILEARIVAKNKEYLEKYGKIVRRLTGASVEISSTDIRTLVRAGASLEGLVPPAVEAYIREKGLYV